MLPNLDRRLQPRRSRSVKRCGVSLMFLSLTLPLATGCASSGPKSAEETVVLQEDGDGSTDGSDKSEAASSRKITVGDESKADSLKTCAYYGIPDVVLGAGALMVIANPIMPVISLGFIGGHYFTCYLFRQDDRPQEVDMAPAIKMAVDASKKETAQEIRAALNKPVHTRSGKDSDDVDQKRNSLDEMKAGLKKAGDQERQSIERTGSKVLREIYEQLDVIKNSEIQIREDDKEEYIPKVDDGLKSAVSPASLKKRK